MPDEASLERTASPQPLTLGEPTVRDGASLYGLVREAGVLDVNSCYAYLLLCRDFRETCVVARRGEQLAGFVTAYRPPPRRESLFVWQVGVGPDFRRQGLAGRMLRHLLSLPACRDARFLEATVASSNTASRRMFESLARQLNVPMCTEPGFESRDFGAESHEAEDLVRVGPLPSGSIRT